jgi:hypothetical protein
MRTSEVNNICERDFNQASGSLQLGATPHPNAPLLQVFQPLHLARLCPAHFGAACFCPAHLHPAHLCATWLPHAHRRTVVAACLPAARLCSEQILLPRCCCCCSVVVTQVATQVTASKLLPRGCCRPGIAATGSPPQN